MYIVYSFCAYWLQQYRFVNSSIFLLRYSLVSLQFSYPQYHSYMEQIVRLTKFLEEVWNVFYKSIPRNMYLHSDCCNFEKLLLDLHWQYLFLTGVQIQYLANIYTRHCCFHHRRPNYDIWDILNFITSAMLFFKS